MTIKLTNLIVAAATTALVSCGGAEGTPIGNGGQKVTETKPDAKPEARKDLMFKLNETIQLGDYVITVSKFVDNAPAPDEFSHPENGKKFVAIEVLYENRTSDKQLEYNPFDWKVIDADGYNYEVDANSAKEPSLNAGTLNPGQKSRGWITFQASKEAKGLKAQFQPNWLSNENVEVQLN